MARITGGEFVYERKTAPAQYESKTARATIAFVVADEDTADVAQDIFDRARDEAVKNVGILLRTKLDLIERTEEPRGPGRPKGAPNRPKVPAEPVHQTTKEPLGAGHVVDVTDPDPTPASTGGTTSSGGALDLPDDPTVGAAVVPVTDAVLMEKIMQKNAALMKPAAIRALVATYAGPAPKTARDVPAEKRPAFLLELEALS